MFFVLCLSTQKGPGHREWAQGGFNLRSELRARKKCFFWAPQWGAMPGDAVLYTKNKNLASIG
jgi:hypothetical protein